MKEKMKVYYLEDGNGRRVSRTAVTSIQKVPELLRYIKIGAAQLSNVKVTMGSPDYQDGFGIVEFKYVGEMNTLNVVSLEILK